MLLQELSGVVVELIRLVSVGGPGCGGVIDMDGGFAGECPSLYAGVDQMRAPGCRVAGHEEADGHGGVRLWDMRALWGLGEIMGFVLGAEVREHGERGGLVVLGAECGDKDIDGYKREEEEAFEEGGGCTSGWGDGGDRGEEELCEGFGGEDVEKG